MQYTQACIYTYNVCYPIIGAYVYMYTGTLDKINTSASVRNSACGQFHVTTDTTQKNKSSYAEYLVLVLYCTHITCHGFKGNMQIQLNNYEISPFAQLCEKL